MFWSSNKDFDFAEITERRENYNVPKTIHFIWTGKPIEEKYIKNIQTFVMNQDYEVGENSGYSDVCLLVRYRFVIDNFMVRWKYFEISSFHRGE